MDYDDDEKDHKGFLRTSVDEVFYLSREENGNDIFITHNQTRKLQRHQHRGLRFLYRQYKMKKPGVIMNDVSGFGKKVQTAVFLDAIKQTLSQPALILCNEIERDNWKYYFMHFGRDYKEILSFDASLPSSDKKIFIRSFDDIETVIKKTWSIAVVDDPVSIRLFKPLKNLKAAFRIWVVSIDLKCNLNTFAAINDWINPNNTFSIQDFTAKSKTASEIIEKAVLLDRYFEELVLSRGHEKKKDEKKQPNKTKTSTVNPKKNKDLNSTKAKKSKTNTTVSKPSTSTVSKPSTSKAGSSKDSNKKAKKPWNSKKQCDSSDESWDEPIAAKRKKRNKPIKTPEDDYRRDLFLNMSSSDEDNNEMMYIANEYLKSELRNRNEMKRLDRTENYAVKKDSDTLKVLQNQSKDTTLNKEDIRSNSLDDSIDFRLDTIPMEVEDSATNKSDEIIVIETKNPESNKINENNSKEESKTADGIESIQKNKETEMEIDLPQAETSYSKMDESIIDTKIRDLEHKTNAQFKGSFLDKLLESNKTSPKNIASTSNSDKIDKKPDDAKKTHELVNKSPKASISKVVETDKLASPVKMANESPTKGSPQKIDDQIKALEQKTYNKFKGSLLDKLF